MGLGVVGLVCPRCRKEFYILPLDELWGWERPDCPHCKALSSSSAMGKLGKSADHPENNQDTRVFGCVLPDGISRYDLRLKTLLKRTWSRLIARFSNR